MATDYERLWRQAVVQSSLPLESIHGPAHWLRVEQNGLVLSLSTGADIEVVRLFAALHDSRRESDGEDPDHGSRAADLAVAWRGALFELSDSQFEKLCVACRFHTSMRHHEDRTIATCWDADRLDLVRVGRVPDPGLMSTEGGRQTTLRMVDSAKVALMFHSRHRGQSGKYQGRSG
jgi:uncharacterized protein